jgi:hypothetical protein
MKSSSCPSKKSRISTRRASSFAYSLLLLTGAGACGPSDDDNDGASPEGVVVEDENNYTAVATLTLPVTETASGVNVEFCLDDLTKNLQCHDRNPIEDIDNVIFLQVPGMTKDEVTAKLEADTFGTSDVRSYFEYNTNHSESCINLQDMEFVGRQIDPTVDFVEDPDTTYLVLFSQGTVPGTGAQSMLFLDPKASSQNVAAPAQTGCEMLEFVPDLQSSTPLDIKNAGPWNIDWRNLTRDSQGNPVQFNKVDRLVVGFYEGFTLAQLEEQVFDLESLPKDLYEIPINGERTADLSDAVHTVSGEKFAGFSQETDGIWIFGLLCGQCQTPAPIVLSTLNPVD